MSRTTLPYYYSRLDKEGQMLYSRIRTYLYKAKNTTEGIVTIQLGKSRSDIDIKMLTDQLSEILAALKKDDPWMFWCDFSHFSVISSNYIIFLKVGLYYCATEIRKHERVIKSWLEEKKKKLWAERIEKREHRIYAFLKGYVEYSDTDHFEEHTIWGVIYNKKAVCEGIAHTFALLCRELQIPCIVVHGRGDADEIVLDGTGRNVEYNHAWNMVRIHGSLYYVDITNDLYNPYRWRYFNKTTKEMAKDHFVPDDMPIC